MMWNRPIRAAPEVQFWKHTTVSEITVQFTKRGFQIDSLKAARQPVSVVAMGLKVWIRFLIGLCLI